MKNKKQSIRQAFQKPPCLLVKVLPKGFCVEDQIIEKLTGRIVKSRLIRKRFEENTLVCDSLDGELSREGRMCSECRHADCRPLLRIHLFSDGIRYVIDLAFTAANNFFCMEDQAEARGEKIKEWDLSLYVVDHGRWGEVRFDRV